MATAQAHSDRLLKPEVLARLGTLELVARAVVDGVMSGLHRSPHFGFSQEFAEYRAYNEGDDLRFVDWNVYARTDRAYVKRFEGETNTSITLLLDASASMGWGEPTSKFDYARYLVASIAWLVRKQHDALALSVFADQERVWLPPSSRPDSLHRALARLERVQPADGTQLIEALNTLRARHHRRGLIVLVSDLYADAEALERALQVFVHGGQEIAVFQVLDPRELEPAFGGFATLRDVESGAEYIVDPDWMQQHYGTRMSEHCDAIRASCTRIGAEYRQLLTDEPLDAALQQFLHFRGQREA